MIADRQRVARCRGHPSRCWDWCMPEDDKKEIEKLWEDE